MNWARRLLNQVRENQAKARKVNAEYLATLAKEERDKWDSMRDTANQFFISQMKLIECALKNGNDTRSWQCEAASRSSFLYDKTLAQAIVDVAKDEGFEANWRVNDAGQCVVHLRW